MVMESYRRLPPEVLLRTISQSKEGRKLLQSLMNYGIHDAGTIRNYWLDYLEDSFERGDYQLLNLELERIRRSRQSMRTQKNRRPDTSR